MNSLIPNVFVIWHWHTRLCIGPGNIPCIVNAANEVVVDAFLKDKISFLGMSDVIEQTMGKVAYIKEPTYEDYVDTDAEARRVALSLCHLKW